MKMYHVLIPHYVQKKLQKIPRTWQVRIIKKLEYLAIDPYQGKKLQGEHEGKYSVRIWPYRVLYSIDSGMLIIQVLDLGHRKDIYR